MYFVAGLLQMQRTRVSQRKDFLFPVALVLFLKKVSVVSQSTIGDIMCGHCVQSYTVLKTREVIQPIRR